MKKRIYLSITIWLFFIVHLFSQTDINKHFLEYITAGSLENSEELFPEKSLQAEPYLKKNTEEHQEGKIYSTITLNTGFAVGATAGVGDVTSTGAASYQIPIEVPQGVAGLEPVLSVNYNSQRGNGLMGYGWNLTAFSSITRSGHSFYYDDNTVEPKLNDADNLMLDGQRLILISGTKFKDGAKYRLEYDPTTDITFKTINSYPCLIVRTKDGITKEYGSTAKSNIQVSDNITLFWLLSKITDGNGNIITYDYEYVKASGKCEFYLTDIKYAGTRSIKLEYETRNDKQKSYTAGIEINGNKRLKSISTFINQTLIKKYQFNYVYDVIYSKLTEVIENGQNNQRYNSTIIDYGISTMKTTESYAKLSTKRLGNLPLFADFNGNGKMDFLSYEEKTSYTTSDSATLFLIQDAYGLSFTKKSTIPMIINRDAVFQGFLLADLNGDGKMDIVNISKAANGTYRYNYYISDGEKLTYGGKGFNTDGNEAFVGDFNGDGKHDILVKKNNKVFDGEGREIASGGIDNWGSEYIKDYYPNCRYLCDFTGNGKTNIMAINGTEAWVYELKGKEFIKLTSFTTKEIKNSYFPYFGDFNGDGKTDVLLQIGTDPNNVYILFSTGNGFVKQKTTNADIRSIVQIGDFNKDGKSEIFHKEVVNNTVKMKVGVLDGTNFITETYTSALMKPADFNVPSGPNTKRAYENALFVVADFDGDGRADFCNALNRETYTFLSFKDPLSLLTERITDGLGAQTFFEYAPLTNNTVCANTENEVSFPVAGNVYPLYVVREMKLEAKNHLDRIRYQYRNPRMHVQGKGFLGFEEIETINEAKERKITTKYGYNKFYYPFVTEQKILHTSGSAISSSVYVNEYIVNGDTKRITPYIQKQTETDNLTNTTKTIDYKIDNWGNPLTVEIKYGTDVTETITSTYSNSETVNVWRIGAPLTVQKKTVKSSGNWTEKQTYEYNEKYLLKKSIHYTSDGTKKISENTFEYDSFGNLTKETTKPFTSTNVLSTSYAYSTDGVYLIKKTDPMSFATSWKYNASGWVESSTDYLNNTTTYNYDGMGRLIKTTYPDKTYSTTTFSWGGSVTNSVYYITEVTQGKPTVKTYFDNMNRELRSSIVRFNNTELHTDRKYDGAGRLSQESLPFKGSTASRWNTFSYDKFGRLTQLSYASGKKDTYSYSGKNRTETIEGIATTKTFNSKGELISVVDPAGTITYTLRPDGQPSRISAPGSIITTFGYDEYGRRNEINDPSVGKRTFTYDTAGNLKEEIDANNKKKTMVYDKYGRITSKTLPEFTTTFTYNTQGFLSSESSTNGTSRTYQYDSYGRLSKDRDNGPDNKWLERTFTYATGNLSSIQFTSQSGSIGTENYTYVNGEVTELKFGTTSIWKLSAENDLGLPTSVLTGPVTRTYTYNAFGIPTERKASSSTGGTFQNYTYSFDSTKDNLTYRKDNIKNKQENFTYDNLNRLKTYPGVTMEYDIKGNIIRKSDISSTFHYTTLNKPYAISRIDLGKNTAIPVREQIISYTSFERPSKISENNYESTFTYSNSGDRKKMHLKKGGNNELQRYYLGERYEIDTKPSSTKQQLYIGGDAYSAPAVYVNQGSSWVLYYICRDYLGSITHIINTSGTVSQEYSYDVWGRLRNPSTHVVYLPGNEPTLFLDRGYTGHEHLSVFGLIQMNARLYDPAIGRFLSPDPYVQAPDISQNFNRFSYGMNNPLKYTDPDGELAWFVIPLVAAAIGGTTNLVANLKNVNGFWQGLATFGVGAGAGLATAATAGAGASVLGVAGVAAAGSAATGATNSIVAQTGTNFSGFGSIDWGQVGVNGAVSGVAGFAGGAAGGWAANSSWAVNGISHPLAKAVVVSPFAAGAGHIAGGTTAGLFQGQSFHEAFANSFHGIEKSMAIGGGLGVATTAGMMYANGINPWTGNRIGIRTSINAYKHTLEYDARVRMRGVQDPHSHNFPYSFDDTVLSTPPIPQKNGYQIFQYPGTMNGKNGFFEIGVKNNGVIDHRFFRPF